MTQNESITPDGAESSTKKSLLAIFGQSLIFLTMAAIAMVLTQQFPQAQTAVAPTELFFVAYSLFVLVTLLHFPIVFFRFSVLTKRIFYGAAIGAIIFLVTMSVTVILAYRNSPEGQQGLADARAWEKEYAGIIAQHKKDDARMAGLIGKAEAEKGKFEAVEACFSIFGKRLPEFESQVKDRLHNPAAFKHVKTAAIHPDYEGNNVEMEFRAENGFGGTRTAHAYATISTDSCKVISLKLPD